MPFRHRRARRPGLIRGRVFRQRFAQRRGHLSVGHGTDPHRRRGRERTSSGGCPVRLKQEARDVRVRILAQASPIRRRHVLLHVPDQFRGSARSPGIHEIAAGQRWSFVSSRQVRQMAACAIGQIHGTPVICLARGIRRRSLASAGTGGHSDDRDQGERSPEDHVATHSIASQAGSTGKINDRLR